MLIAAIDILSKFSRCTISHEVLSLLTPLPFTPLLS